MSSQFCSTLKHIFFHQPTIFEVMFSPQVCKLVERYDCIFCFCFNSKVEMRFDAFVFLVPSRMNPLENVSNTHLLVRVAFLSSRIYVLLLSSQCLFQSQINMLVWDNLTCFSPSFSSSGSVIREQAEGAVKEKVTRKEVRTGTFRLSIIYFPQALGCCISQSKITTVKNLPHLPTHISGA